MTEQYVQGEASPAGGCFGRSPAIGELEAEGQIRATITADFCEFRHR